MIYAVKIDIIIFNIKSNIEDDKVAVPVLILKLLSF